MEGFRCPSIARRAYLRHVILYAPRTPLSAEDNKCYDLFSPVRQRKCISYPHRISASFLFLSFRFLRNEVNVLFHIVSKFIKLLFLSWLLDTLSHSFIPPPSSSYTMRYMCCLIIRTLVILVLICSFTMKKKHFPITTMHFTNYNPWSNIMNKMQCFIVLVHWG